MTTTSTPSRVRPQSQTVAVTGLAIAGVIIFAGNYHLERGENGGLGPAVITAVGCLLATAVLYATVLPRTRRPNRSAVVLGILAVLSLAVFWSGITPVLAGAAVAASATAPATSRGARIVQAAGVVAAVLALVVTLAQSHLS